MSSDIIKDIELGRAPLSAIGLKALRLARMLNDSQVEHTLVGQSSCGGLTDSTEKLENTIDKGRAVLQSPYSCRALRGKVGSTSHGESH